MLCLVAWRTADGQTLATLRGTVKDPSGAVIAGASVSLNAMDSERAHDTHTDAIGEFHFEAVPLGQYTLRVEHAGFVAMNRPIQVTEGAMPEVELIMALSGATTTVEVKAGREELLETLSPGTVSVVYPDDTKGEFKSLPDLLDEVPGVYVRRVSGTGQYTTTSVRGSSPTEVNIYVDGVPFNLASEVAADLSTIPVNDVERVEVYRGTVPAQFSGAPIGGAINIVTKTPTSFSGSASAGVRSLGGRQFSLSANGPVAGGKILFSADEDRSRGNFNYTNYDAQSLDEILLPADSPLGAVPACEVNDECGPSGRTRTNNSYNKENLLAKWQNDKFSAKWSYLYLNRLMPYSVGASPDVDTAAAGLGYGARHDQQLNQSEGVVGWRHSFGRLSTRFLLNLMEQDKLYTNPDAVFPYTAYLGGTWSHYYTRRYGSEVDASYQTGNGSSGDRSSGDRDSADHSGYDHSAIRQRFEFHADWSQESLHAGANDMYYLLNGVETTNFLPFFRRYKTDFQLQDTVTVRFLHNLEITPVGRMERLTGPTIGDLVKTPFADPSGNYGWKPNGGVALKQRFARGWQAYASYGKYIRYPSFYEIYGDGINVIPQVNSNGSFVPLQAETGRNLDAGTGWDGGLAENLGGHFRLTYFRRDTDNNITLLRTPIASTYHNTGDTIQHGVEFEGSLHYRKFAGLQTALTVQDGWYRDQGMYVWGFSTPMLPAPRRTIPTLNAPFVTGDARLDLHFFKGALTTFFETKYTGQNVIGVDGTVLGDANNPYELYEGVNEYERALPTFDLGVHWQIRGGGTLSAGVTDLFGQGPKQILGGAGAGAFLYAWETCSLAGVAVANCPAGDVLTHDFSAPIKQNVYYPQQGRTVYVLLAWDVHGWHSPWRPGP
jgi:outer membrane receptor protein involved in Fe transport